MGIPGSTTQHAARGGSHTSEAGPGRHRVPGVGGCGARAPWGTSTGTAAGTVLRPPFGPGQPPQWPPCLRTSQIAASQPIGARLTSISYKVSQNGQVSTKKCQKACHSPCFIFKAQKSPLEIPRFLFWPAFSHKELMVPKQRCVDI